MPWGVTTTGLTALQQRWTYASQRLGQVVGGIVQKRLDEAVVYAKATYLTGGTTSTRLAERTGRVKASFAAQVQVGSQGGGALVTAQIGYLDDPPHWIDVHEGLDGRSSTTIRPKTAKYLAIPLTEEARSMPPRQMGNTFVARSRAGNLLIFRKIEGGGIVPEYVLKTEVVIPTRPALQPTMAKFTPLIVDDLKGAVKMLFTGGR
jgi:hypothetical protein